jgi:hypothetical protein|tara:strand:+ start:1889 stop:2323 length:435 start_codon:yes stop_codon:yes gene_type:complete
MQLKKLILNTKSAWVDYPGLEGFSIEVVNLSRKELQGLRKKCLTNKLDRKTRQMEEVLDEAKFVVEFTASVIKDWKGFTLEAAQELLLLDIGDQDPSQEIDYTLDNAEALVSSSTEFDTWLNEVIFDLANFRGDTSRSPVEETE